MSRELQHNVWSECLGFIVLFTEKTTHPNKQNAPPNNKTNTKQKAKPTPKYKTQTQTYNEKATTMMIWVLLTGVLNPDIPFGNKWKIKHGEKK